MAFLSGTFYNHGNSSLHLVRSMEVTKDCIPARQTAFICAISFCNEQDIHFRRHHPIHSSHLTSVPYHLLKKKNPPHCLYLITIIPKCWFWYSLTRKKDHSKWFSSIFYPQSLFCWAQWKWIALILLGTSAPCVNLHTRCWKNQLPKIFIVKKKTNKPQRSRVAEIFIWRCITEQLYQSSKVFRGLLAPCSSTWAGRHHTASPGSAPSHSLPTGHTSQQLFPLKSLW